MDHIQVVECLHPHSYRLTTADALAPDPETLVEVVFKLEGRLTDDVQRCGYGALLL